MFFKVRPRCGQGVYSGVQPVRERVYDGNFKPDDVGGWISFSVARTVSIHSRQAERYPLNHEPTNHEPTNHKPTTHHFIPQSHPTFFPLQERERERERERDFLHLHCEYWKPSPSKSRLVSPHDKRRSSRTTHFLWRRWMVDQKLHTFFFYSLIHVSICAAKLWTPDWRGCNSLRM